MGAKALLERAQQVKRQLHDIGENAIIETKQDFIELNIDQLKHGEKADGSQIGRYKNKYYALYKYRKNVLAGEGNIDLIDQKNFIKGLDIVKNADHVEEFSRDDKFAMLTENYGENILGLQDKNITTYRRKSFLPSVRKRVTAIYNG